MAGVIFIFYIGYWKKLDIILQITNDVVCGARQVKVVCAKKGAHRRGQGDDVQFVVSRYDSQISAFLVTREERIEASPRTTRRNDRNYGSTRAAYTFWPK